MPWQLTVVFDDGSVAVETMQDPFNVCQYVQLCLGGHPPRRITIVSEPAPCSPAPSAPWAGARKRPRRPSSADSPASSLRR